MHFTAEKLYFVIFYWAGKEWKLIYEVIFLSEKLATLSLYLAELQNNLGLEAGVM
jgi:hypothetical protein